jgi:hypothetical protein
MGDIRDLPFNVEPVPNEPRIEFMYDVLEGHPPARQKRIILRAADPQVAFLTPEQATRLISSLGIAGE